MLRPSRDPIKTTKTVLYIEHGNQKAHNTHWTQRTLNSGHARLWARQVPVMLSTMLSNRTAYQSLDEG